MNMCKFVSNQISFEYLNQLLGMKPSSTNR